MSGAGIRDILSTLAAAGVTIYHHETDGDTFIDLTLTPETHVVQTVLSWRETETWMIRDYTADDPNPAATYSIDSPPDALDSVAAEVTTSLGLSGGTR